MFHLPIITGVASHNQTLDLTQPVPRIMSRIMRKIPVFPLFFNLKALQGFNFGIKLSQSEDELAGMQIEERWGDGFH